MIIVSYYHYTTITETKDWNPVHQKKDFAVTFEFLYPQILVLKFNKIAQQMKPRYWPRSEQIRKCLTNRVEREMDTFVTIQPY